MSSIDKAIEQAEVLARTSNFMGIGPTTYLALLIVARDAERLNKWLVDEEGLGDAYLTESLMDLSRVLGET